MALATGVTVLTPHLTCPWLCPYTCPSGSLTLGLPGAKGIPAGLVLYFWPWFLAAGGVVVIIITTILLLPHPPISQHHALC